MEGEIIYRDHIIYPAFMGWKVKEPSGAHWPEKYLTPEQAKSSIDLTLRLVKR